MASWGSMLGNAGRRLEDPTLLTGGGKYVDDLVEPNMAHVAFVRSPIAHAKVASVDVSEAAAMPGVAGGDHGGGGAGAPRAGVAGVSPAAGDDLGLPSLQGFAMMPPSLNRPVFAADTVRF